MLVRALVVLVHAKAVQVLVQMYVQAVQDLAGIIVLDVLVIAETLALVLVGVVLVLALVVEDVEQHAQPHVVVHAQIHVITAVLENAQQAVSILAICLAQETAMDVAEVADLIVQADAADAVQNVLILVEEHVRQLADQDAAQDAKMDLIKVV